MVYKTGQPVTSTQLIFSNSDITFFHLNGRWWRLLGLWIWYPLRPMKTLGKTYLLMTWCLLCNSDVSPAVSGSALSVLGYHIMNYFHFHCYIGMDVLIWVTGKFYHFRVHVGLRVQLNKHHQLIHHLSFLVSDQLNYPLTRQCPECD